MTENKADVLILNPFISRAWTQLTTKLDIDWRGPVNIVRFAPNAGKHHVLAVGAKDVHVIHITQMMDKTPSKFKFEPQKMISDQLNKINLEKCWVSVKKSHFFNQLKILDRKSVTTGH